MSDWLSWKSLSLIGWREGCTGDLVRRWAQNSVLGINFRVFCVCFVFADSPSADKRYKGGVIQWSIFVVFSRNDFSFLFTISSDVRNVIVWRDNSTRFFFFNVVVNVFGIFCVAYRQTNVRESWDDCNGVWTRIRGWNEENIKNKINEMENGDE